MLLLCLNRKNQNKKKFSLLVVKCLVIRSLWRNMAAWLPHLPSLPQHSLPNANSVGVWQLLVGEGPEIRNRGRKYLAVTIQEVLTIYKHGAPNTESTSDREFPNSESTLSDVWTRVLLSLSLFFLGFFPFPRSTPCSFSSSFLPGVRRLSPAAPAAASLPLRAPHLLPPSGGRRPADPRQCGAPGRGRGGGAWERPSGRPGGGAAVRETR